MARARGARTSTVAAFESVYGTPPAGGWFQMPFASNTLGGEQELLDNELLGYGRDPLAPVLDALDADGALSVPIDAEAFGFWLKGAFGQPVTTGSGPYTHVYSSNGWVTPSIAIEKQMPDVPSYQMYSGCKVQRLGWGLTRTGQLRSTIDLLAQGEDKAAATGAGAPTPYALARFGNFNGSIEREGAVLGNVVSADLAYSNQLDRVEVIRNDGKIDGLDEGMGMLTGTCTVRFADNVLYDQAVAGAPCELDFGYVKGANSLNLVAHAVYFSRPRAPIDGPQGIQVTFNWKAAQGGPNNRLCDVTLVNDVADYG